MYKSVNVTNGRLGLTSDENCQFGSDMETLVPVSMMKNGSPHSGDDTSVTTPVSSFPIRL